MDTEKVRIHSNISPLAVVFAIQEKERQRTHKMCEYVNFNLSESTLHELLVIYVPCLKRKQKTKDT